MTTEQEDRLHTLLRVACEDALFAIAGHGTSSFAAFAERRTAAHESIARQGLANSVVMADWDAWRNALVRDAAAAFAPWFVPMHHAIDEGLTLLQRPRGLRAVIPIGVEAAQARTRRDGMLAVRIARAVAAADGEVSAEEARSIELLITALGLPEADVRVLTAEAPIPLGALDLPEEPELKTARILVAGAFQVAACDGLEDRELAAVLTIADRLRLESQTVAEIRGRIDAELAAQRRIGRALIDVARYVLATSPHDEARALIRAAIHLAIPPVDRTEMLRAVDNDATTPLSEPHPLDRNERDRVLAGAWAMALALDPTLSLRARLRARHDRAAEHLDAGRRAEDARALVEKTLEEILSRGAAVVGA